MNFNLRAEMIVTARNEIATMRKNIFNRELFSLTTKLILNRILATPHEKRLVKNAFLSENTNKLCSNVL